MHFSFIGEQLVGAGEMHAHPPADADVAERGGEVGLADPDRSQDHRRRGVRR